MPLAEHWWIGKSILLAGAVLLYFLHGRMLFTLGTTAARGAARKGLALLTILVAVYILSGAVLKVGYGYTHRGALLPDDAAWFRQEFAPFGPIPVASLFGPAFRGYLGSFPRTWRLNPTEDAQRWDDTRQHRRDLRHIIEHMPNSIWAPSAAEVLGRMDEGKKAGLDSALSMYRLISEKYPEAPYQIQAMRGSARALADAKRDEEARKAYADLLKRVPGSRYESEALYYLIESEKNRGNLAAAISRAEEWTQKSLPQERFTAFSILAELHQKAGHKEPAAKAAEQALRASNAYRIELAAGKVRASQVQLIKWQGDAALADNRSRAVLAWAHGKQK
jgi:outer membrane protein assembly factor BamD (BamD/ComL family)